MTSNEGSLPGSFRDPAGFVFQRNGILYRHVNDTYREHYDALMTSGLYAAVVERGDLIPHEELPPDPGACRTLRPDRIPFISYPYEWCFGQLREAALLVLRVQETALDHDMTLKDASAYNVQFQGASPVLIDTLSFEKYSEGSPWIAYRQFCQHFLAPLALMARVDARLGSLSRIHLDGVPLDLAAKLLPLGSRLNPGLLAHVHLHAKSQKLFADKPVRPVSLNMRKSTLRNLISSLRNTVAALKSPAEKTEWGGYYRDNSYSEEALGDKLAIVTRLLKASRPETVWDMGANNGMFSRAASDLGIQTISFDLDHAAVEANFNRARAEQERNLLPLVLDVTNPSPALGWANQERDALPARGPADTVLALALIHHLAISNQLPLEKIADYFSSICRSLIIEFVPKTDVQVQRLLASREDLFPDYREEAFIAAFGQRFKIHECIPIADSPRKIYRLETLLP